MVSHGYPTNNSSMAMRKSLEIKFLNESIGSYREITESLRAQKTNRSDKKVKFRSFLSLVGLCFLAPAVIKLMISGKSFNSNIQTDCYR